MEIEALVQSILHSESLPPVNAADGDIAALTHRLKQEADRHWLIDPHISLRFAAVLVSLGEQTGETGITALGLMARGDALKLLNHLDEAWETLDRSGELYLATGDEVGWARTRIGKLGIALELNQHTTALRDAETARNILRSHGELEKLLRLELNTGALLNYLGDYRSALAKYQETVVLAQEVGEAGQARLSIAHFNMGYTYQGLGNLKEASDCYERARNLMLTKGESLGVVLADLNIASVAQAQGHYKQALQMLHTMSNVLAQYHPAEVPRAMRDMIECYLFLNRFADARDLTRRMIDQHSEGKQDYDLALTLLQLAVAEIALGDFNAAYDALRRAERLLLDLNASGWLGIVYLRWGQAALRQGDFVVARQQAERAIQQFQVNEQQIYFAAAQLVSGQVALYEDRAHKARKNALEVLRIARRWRIPELEYGAYLLLGRIAEEAGQSRRALNQFQTAVEIIERVQRSLILHYRSDFLEDKQDAIRAVLRLHLAAGHVEAAFTALERAKAQVWLSYLSQRDQLRWFRDNAATRLYVDELERLRQEHHWFYRVAYDQSFREQQHATMLPEDAALEASNRERQIRALTERLYLYSEDKERANVPTAHLKDVQQRLDTDTVLIAYYNDGQSLWAFVVSARQVELFALGNVSSSVDRLITKLQSNFDRALRTDAHSPDAHMLTHYARQLSQQLYGLLIAPFAERLKEYTRLTIVPYGSLHYLAFQVLHDSENYWLEKHEIAILPTASLMMQEAPRQKRGVLAFAHDWDGRLPYTHQEAELVVDRFGGELYADAQANRAYLETLPRQILHLSVHGKHRMDQPDFSYLQLADGPLYTDDLFQHDLSYELVTLSACETGRSHISAGDEPIGLGRGFFFAGAGALLASLWRVDDAFTLELMNSFYGHLNNGASKAAALRQSQLSLLSTYSELHPAYWGAFELIGNTAPLSSEAILEKKVDHVRVL